MASRLTSANTFVRCSECNLLRDYVRQFRSTSRTTVKIANRPRKWRRGSLSATRINCSRFDCQTRLSWVCKHGKVTQNRGNDFCVSSGWSKSNVRRTRRSLEPMTSVVVVSSISRLSLSLSNANWLAAHRKREKETYVPVANVFARCRAFYGGGLDDFARERTARERLSWRRRIIQARSHVAAVGQLLIVLTTQGRVRACYERL